MGLLYLEDEAQAWAEADDAVKHIDSNGAVFTASNTVTLIKYLSVGGGGFMANRVTAVRNISLVPENAEHIEGCISGQQIVILAEFVKNHSIHDVATQVGVTKILLKTISATELSKEILDVVGFVQAN